MRSGQLFTSDFIISAALFMSVLGTVFYGVNATIDQQAQQNHRTVLQRSASQITDLLVRTPGYPSNWTVDTVQVLGLAREDHIIEPEKFMRMRELGYDRFQAMMRLGRGTAVVNITVNGSAVSIGGFVAQEVAVVTDRQRLFDTIAHSGVDWDLYWTGGGTPPATGAATVHNGTAPGMMDAALSNRSGYDAIISDSTGLNASDVTDADRLEAFVDGGGRYLQVGGGDLVTVLGGAAVDGPATTGTVYDTTHLARGLAPMDTVELDAAPVGLTGTGTVLVNTSAGTCLACMLEGGRVLFVAGADLTVASRDANDLETTFLLDQYVLGTNGTFGTAPAADARTIIPVKRDVLIDGQELRLGELAVVVWR